MEKRRLGGVSRLETAPIVFGAWGIGGAPFWENKDREESVRALTTALDNGINMIDTAPVYGFGLSEELVGEAVRGRRDDALIATKCGLRWKSESLKGLYHDLSPASVRQEAEASLKRLGTDRIDLYQIHWPDPNTPLEETMDALIGLKAEGKIIDIGVSNFTLDLLDRALLRAPVACVQPKYNLLEREIESGLLPFCLDRHIGVIAYSPLASGALSGKYGADSLFKDWRGRGNTGVFRKDAWPKAVEKIEKLKDIAGRFNVKLSHLAIRWVVEQPGVTAAIVGCNNAEQTLDNINAIKAEIPTEALSAIDEEIGL